MEDVVNRTRVEDGGYSKHGIVTWFDWQVGGNIIVDVLLYTNHLTYLK